MPASEPTIVATSMGFTSRGRGPWDADPGPVFDLMAGLAQADEPRICYLNQAVGDQPTSLTVFHGAFAGTRYRPSHLALFPMPNVEDVRAHLLGQDVIWVGGGSVANLCAVWRVHGLPEILRECWEAGVVLGGVSAGSICWHVGGTTDSFGRKLRALHRRSGLAAVRQRGALRQRGRSAGRCCTGWSPTAPCRPAHCTDDGVGLVYRGTRLAEAVADRPGVAAYEVVPDGAGGVRETRIEPRLLTA